MWHYIKLPKNMWSEPKQERIKPIYLVGIIMSVVHFIML